MNNEHFDQAVQICIKHKTSVEFCPTKGNIVLNGNNLAIKESCPVTIKELVLKGFSLSLQEGKIFIDKY